MDRVKKLSETIRKLTEGDFSGYITINFSQGSIGMVETFEELDDKYIILTGERRGETAIGKEKYF